MTPPISVLIRTRRDLAATQDFSSQFSALHFAVSLLAPRQNYGNLHNTTMSASKKGTGAAPAAEAGATSALTAPSEKTKVKKSQDKKSKKKSWSSSPQWCKDIATLQIARATPEMKR